MTEAQTETEGTALTLSERVCAAKAEIGPVPKNGYNPHGKYKFASTDDVYHAVGPVLAKHGLDLRLNILSTDVRDRESKDRNGEVKTTSWIFVDAEIGFDGEAFQKRSMAIPISGPQTYEAINSYIQKQYLRARLQIPTGEYDEHDMTTEAPPADAPPPDVITKEEAKEFHGMHDELGWSPTERATWLKKLGDAEGVQILEVESIPSKIGPKAVKNLNAYIARKQKAETADNGPSFFEQARDTLTEPPEGWNKDSLYEAHQFANKHSAEINKLPEAESKTIQGLWASLPDAETGELV